MNIFIISILIVLWIIFWFGMGVVVTLFVTFIDFLVRLIFNN